METPPGAPLKEKLRIEIKKLREMTFKKKIEYIWDYYKLHIIITVAILLVIGGVINALVFNPSPRTVLFISWNTGVILDEQLTELSEALKERIIDEKSNETVAVASLLFVENDPMITMANTNRLVAMLAEGIIDVFILDANQLSEYTYNEFIQPVESLLAEVKSMDSEAYNRIEEKTVYAPFKSGENKITERLMGINISGSSLIPNAYFYGEELFFCISDNSANTENIARALIAFFE